MHSGNECDIFFFSQLPLDRISRLQQEGKKRAKTLELKLIHGRWNGAEYRLYGVVRKETQKNCRQRRHRRILKSEFRSAPCANVCAAPAQVQEIYWCNFKLIVCSVSVCGACALFRSCARVSVSQCVRCETHSLPINESRRCAPWKCGRHARCEKNSKNRFAAISDNINFAEKINVSCDCMDLLQKWIMWDAIESEPKSHGGKSLSLCTLQSPRVERDGFLPLFRMYFDDRNLHGRRWPALRISRRSSCEQSINCIWHEYCSRLSSGAMGNILMHDFIEYCSRSRYPLDHARMTCE